MRSKDNTTRRFIKLLTGSVWKESVVSAIILVIKSLLPLVGLLLLRSFVDTVTGTLGPDTGAVNETVTGAVAKPLTGTLAEGVSRIFAGNFPEGGSVISSLIFIIAAMALLLLADDLLSFAGNYMTRKQSFLAEGHISSLIHAHAGRLGLRFFEDPMFHDRLERAARDISWRPAALIADFITVMRGVISFAAMAYILRNFGFIPLIILIIVFIPVLLIRVRNSGRLYETRKRVTSDSRQASYFSWLLTGEKPAREVKLFDLGGISTGASGSTSKTRMNLNFRRYGEIYSLRAFPLC